MPSVVGIARHSDANCKVTQSVTLSAQPVFHTHVVLAALVCDRNNGRAMGASAR